GIESAELSSADVAKLAIERGLIDSYRQVFAVLFWFTALPGPAGAVLYRACVLVADEWRGNARGTEGTTTVRARARTLLWLLDWVPVRLTALSFAIVGDFEDAVYCWRTQAKSWVDEEGGEHVGLVLASGAGALGVVVGGPLPVTLDEPEYRPELGMGEPADADFMPSALGRRVRR